MEFSTVLILIVGLTAGLGIGFLLAKVKSNAGNEDGQKLRMELEMEQKRGDRQNEEFRNLNDQLISEREKVILLSGDKSRLEANYKNLQERLEEQKKEVNQLQEKFAFEFKNLANEILEEKSKKFTDQNKINIGEILNPLKEKIENFEKKVEQSGKESLQQNTALAEQLKQLKELNQQITKEAESLTKALKGDSKTQGNWGEMQLEMILEKVGLQKDVHYFKEQNFKNEEGANQRLDYIIKMPDDKYLVLDSKVSLTAYSNYFDHDEPELQAKYLKQHIESVNNHIKILGEKNYQNLYEIQQPDFVLMFVANEPALTIALKEDQNLYEKALDKNIVLVSTSTLLATMRTVSYIWKQDLQNKNAIEIARQAGALYDKFEGFTSDLLKVGVNLKQTKDNYDLAMNKLSQGSGNLVRRTETLKELGAKASKQLDQRLLDRSHGE
ncbi:MAG: DNA recombination protein RmuC [Cyclobacteriaceae bacterium]|jgi:DNA recombination protein RmuC